MSPLRLLDLKVPLTGTHLIEASAGTGKTYTLGLLVLRLVLENDFDVRQLAVVTFTEAAAAELADRIGQFLRRARQALLGNNTDPTADPDIAALVDGLCAARGAPLLAQRLDLAELRLDQARITTIHGFCSRLLTEFSFELHAGLGYEHLESEDGLIGEVLAEFWRTHLKPLPAAWQAQVAGLDPTSLASLLGPLLNHPGLPVVGEVTDSVATQAAWGAWGALRRKFEADRPQLEQLLFETPTRFGTKAVVGKDPARALREAEAALQNDSFGADELARFGFTRLTKALNQEKRDFAELGVMRAIEEFDRDHLVHLNQQKSSLLVAAWKYLQEHLPARKAQLRLRSPNDLIRGVYDGLAVASPRSLEAIRSRFRAVFVDEFQDTDPRQYDIFQRLFGPPNPQLVVVVGDPKQAIYGFRGGDIEAYLRAANDIEVSNRHSLATNHRSSARLLEALNLVYEPHLDPFQTASGRYQIGYQRVGPTTSPPPEVTGEGMVLPPLTLWDFDTGKAPRPSVIAARIAYEVQRLKAGARHKDRALQNRDFAILVSSHANARKLRRELAKPPFQLLAVTGQSGSVLQSDEASNLKLTLQALVSPSNLGLVRALLLSSLHGWDNLQLEAWNNDSRAVLGTLGQLSRTRLRWEARGVARALDELLHTWGVWTPPSRSETSLGHQRTVTNYRHLLEILHAQDERLGRQPVRTLRCFIDLMANPDDQAYEQRLEADEGALQIVTMHKAKGLQWPVVFAVDLARDPSPNSKTPPLVEGAEGRQIDFRASASEAAKAYQKAASAQERQRLGYVALTRAEGLLYVVRWKSDKNASSPAQYLFGSVVAPLAGTDRQPLIDVAPLTELGPWVPTPLTHSPDPHPGVRTWDETRHLVPRFMVGSYSGLTRDLSKHPAIPPTSSSGSSLPEFPRGKEAGTALHTVLEKIDFVSPDQARIRSLLASAGIEPQYNETGIQLVETVLQTQLIPGREKASPFSLASLSRQDHAAEVPFYLTAQYGQRDRALTAGRLAEVPGAREAGLELAPNANLSGYLNGVIDLVVRHEQRWYLLDWKSNYLGGSPEDYQQAQLDHAMRSNHYLLQAHLYTVAWDRHLRLLASAPGAEPYDYNLHFGGVFYLFLRGVQPSSSSGIWFHKPPQALITALAELL